jgi:hypothetical protein
LSPSRAYDRGMKETGVEAKVMGGGGIGDEEVGD